jgi:hypothetical protein
MFVYMTTCNINGKKYVGKYEGKETDLYLGSGKLLRRAIRKYGLENFTRIILERYQTAEETRLGEQYWISKFNAVDSDEFYNIAAGGEGGNTFAGIKGSNRIQLIEKLKQRKRPAPRPNMTVILDLMTNERKSVHINEFTQTSYYVGQQCNGIYITPYGVFSSLLKMSIDIGIDMSSMKKKCANNTMFIRKCHLQGLKEGTEYYNDIITNIGKTFKDIGYDFISIDKLLYKDLEFYKQLNILK